MVLFSAAFAVAWLPAMAGDLAEVQLLDSLDEPRRFCFDLVGYKSRARPERGLQAHTCYSYQGSVAVDQGFDRARALQGEFYLPHFDVCVTAASRQPDARLTLAVCNRAGEQKFTLHGSGEITPAADRTLCVTAASGDSREGGGGDPVHLIRALSLQPCARSREPYQRWRLGPPGK